MDVPVSEAKGQLLELVRRVEAGEEIVLTRHGKAVARLTAIRAQPSPEERRRVLAEVRASARQAARSGPPAARSQDFLYGDDGLPR